MNFWRHFRTFFSNSAVFKLPVDILEQDIVEKFIKGSGAGGQKINKTSSCVQLTHLPSGIKITTQRFRGLADNRKEARKLLKLKLDEIINGSESKIQQKILKLQKQKSKQRQRTNKKSDSKDPPIDPSDP